MIIQRLELPLAPPKIGTKTWNDANNATSFEGDVVLVMT
jgi:hypothetical protein